MNLKHLTDDELHSSNVAATGKERMSTIEVLWHLRENNRRMLYAKMGYKDLKEYCVKELKYSEGSAWKRISAMKSLVEVPEIEDKIESGSLNLTQLSMARTHFREVRATAEEKKEILLNLENQSTRMTERILAESKPEDFIPKETVKEKAVKGNKLEVTLILDEELQKELDEIQVLIGKPLSKLELLKLMTKEKLANLRKQNAPKTRQTESLRKQDALKAKRLRSEELELPKINNSNPQLSSAAEKAESSLKASKECKAQSAGSRPAAKSRYISQFTLRKIKQRDQHRCQYKDPKTHRQCEAKFFLQSEHIIPFAKGGSSEISNLQLLCPTHNRLRAIEQYGINKIKNYLPQLRS
jgi:5-methylcytosine-specific restriction endonuclease McrA